MSRRFTPRRFARRTDAATCADTATAAGEATPADTTARSGAATAAHTASHGDVTALADAATPADMAVNAGAATNGDAATHASTATQTEAATQTGATARMTVTARGMALAASGLVLLAAGFRFGYPELAILGCAALTAVAFGIGYAQLRPTLSVRRVAQPDRVTRGESSTVTLTVHNLSRWRAMTLDAYDRCGDRRIPVPILRLPAGKETTTSYPVPTARRGVVLVGPLRISRSDPLGLASVTRSYGEPVQVWVYPRSYPLAAVPAGITRSLDGRIDRVPHGSITFATLRKYVVGDELRHVHWRTSAKVGELMVREHTDTSLPRLVLLLDDRITSWPAPGSESAVRPEPQARPDAETQPDSAARPDSASRPGSATRSDADARTEPTEAFEAACEAAASVIAAAVREDLPVVLHLVCADQPSQLSSNGRTDLGAAQPLGSRARHDAARVRGLLDRLAAAVPSTPDGDALAVAAARLRQRRVGDTLIYFTGAGGVPDLGVIAALRGAYPSVVISVLGAQAPVPSTVEGVLVIDAPDGPAFAAAWDGIRIW